MRVMIVGNIYLSSDLHRVNALDTYSAVNCDWRPSVSLTLGNKQNCILALSVCLE